VARSCVHGLGWVPDADLAIAQYCSIYGDCLTLVLQLIFSFRPNYVSQCIDVKDETITLSDTGLEFKGNSSGKDYSVSIEFFKAVNAEGSTYKVLPRSVQMHILKKDKEEEEFWPRLLKDKALEKNQVNIDWDRYVDEDEQDGGFDMSALEGGQG
jgi:hypothetical protein